jgi:hypothetical protein
MRKPRKIARHLFGSILAMTGLISGASLLPRPPIVAPAVCTHESGTAFQTAASGTELLQFSTGGHVLGFAADGVCVASGSHALRVEFVNARATNPVSDAAPGDAATSQALSNTQRAARLSQVTYPNLWDGVTLTYDAPSGAIVRSAYRLDPYANVDNIRLRYNAPLSVQGDGSLRIAFQTEAINESAPQAWQEREGKYEPVQIAFAPCGKDEIRFDVGEYNRSGPLFIDPTITFDPFLTWNTFLGGNGEDFGSALAVDGSGNVYVAGQSRANWGSPVRAFSGGYDLFAAKLDSDGHLTWNTFLGSGGEDGGAALAVDGSGNVYVAGTSGASWGSPVRAYSGDSFNPFVAKLSDTTPTPGGNNPPVINSLTGGLSGDTLTLTIVAADADGDLAQAQVSLLNESNRVVTQLQPIALSNDPSPSRLLTLNINGMAQFPSALKTSVALVDSRGDRSGASTFDFSRADAGGPNLRRSSFDDVGSMTITGGPFAGVLQLEINGVVVAPPLGIKIKRDGAKLKIGGSQSDLNLRSGANRVRLLSGGLPSNIFVLTI